MGDGKEYISRPDELGNIHISEDVLAVIAAAAAFCLLMPARARRARGWIFAACALAILTKKYFCAPDGASDKKQTAE